MIFHFRNYDVAVGGIPVYHSNHSRSIHSVPYGTDQLTWCVSHAKPMPQWKNISRFVKYGQRHLAILWIVVYYLISGGVFFVSGSEKMNWDFWLSTNKAFQVVLQTGMVLRYNLKWSTIIFVATGLLGAFVHAVTVLCFYISVVQVQFDEHQIATRSELIDRNFQLAGDIGVLSMINDGEMVR